ncbi:DUF2637 domain-containing protein [Microtetraspora malaysiensis]|uniref:DUF2637 domain-containing protein n=1 Tax=Microtetraspora malaysiensis TaxID=161358 RepID=UPI003D92CFDE
MEIDLSLAMHRIRRTTIAGVVLLAAVADVVSFRHMRELCLRHGEDHLAAVLIPLAVDGLIVVASMSILLASRYGSRGGLLAWSLLAAGSLASLGANVAIAEPTLIGRGTVRFDLPSDPADARSASESGTPARGDRRLSAFPSRLQARSKPHSTG